MAYNEHIEWAKKEFNGIEKKKQDIILELAERLEKDGMSSELISAYISDELSKDGYVSTRYVRDVLKDKKYKDKNKVREQSAEVVPQLTITNEGNSVPVQINEGDYIESGEDIEKKVATLPVIDSEDFERQNNAEQIENQFLKEENTQLKEAMQKLQQFKPATAFEVEKAAKLEPHTKEMGFEFLREASDGIHSFYYDAYGIDLFKNRELAQLKNSGVKTFKRLYFEV